MFQRQLLQESLNIAPYRSRRKRIELQETEYTEAVKAS